MILAQRRTLEDPRNSLSSWPEESGLISDSGQKIDRKTAMKYSPVWRAVMLVSSTVGKIPCRIYARTKSGKDRSFSHPSYSLLRYKPNSEQTSFNFFQTIMGHVLLFPGNAYAYIARDGSARPTELIPLDPRNCCPVRKNGELSYVYNSPSGGDMRRLSPEDVLHFKGLGYDGLVGYSVLEYARNSIGMGLGAQKYSNKFFANNAEARVVLEYPDWIKPEQVKQIKTGWDSMHKGLDKAHSTAVLQGGMKANVISLSARDSQLIEALKWSVVDIANWFGVPPHKLGDSSRTGYNSLEQENQSFLDDTIDPWFVMIEQECRDKLLTEEEKATDSRIIEFDRSVLVRADIKSRAIYYRQALSGYPWMTPDEVRQRENLNGVGLSEIVPPTNNFGNETKDTDKGTTEPTPVLEQKTQVDNTASAQAMDAATVAYKDAVGRMVRRLTKAVERGKKRHDHDQDAFDSALKSERAAIKRALILPGATLCAIIEEDCDEYVEKTLADLEKAVWMKCGGKTE